MLNLENRKYLDVKKAINKKMHYLRNKLDFFDFHSYIAAERIEKRRSKLFENIKYSYIAALKGQLKESLKPR